MLDALLAPLRAELAEAGCPQDHGPVEYMCHYCGWHKHECDACGATWEHDARIVHAAQMFGQFVYDGAHRCACGNDVRNRVRFPNALATSSDDAAVPT